MMKFRTQISATLVGILGALCAFEQAVGAQDLRALARAHAASRPGEMLHLVGPPGDYSPKGIGQLARESDVVLRGRLVRIKTYLGRDEDRILTDYRIDVEQLIAGRLAPVTTATPGGVPPILTAYGGELTIEGVLARAIAGNREPIVEGRTYLLFVRHSRSGNAGEYEIYHGGIFEILDQRVRPLLRGGGHIFKEAAGSQLDNVVLSITMGGRQLP